ncbi:MAG TPA: helix-hairpin-helix domain-containing protein [Gammaproteobacteria bacterium]
MNRKSLPTAVLATLLFAPAAFAGPVNVNSADAETLARELTGVGPAIAEAIVRDREENGPFTSPDDLVRVRGVGERIVEMNRANILVEDPKSAQ